ncbi:Olfactomedin-like protein 2B [Bienertia sinuspersici]
MPHYNGTKSFAHLRQEIRQKNEGKCSQVDVLVASCTRKSKKAVNALTLEKNTIAIDEIKKLKKQSDQGLHDKQMSKFFRMCLAKIHMELIEVKKKADQLIEEVRKDVENVRKEAEQSKKEAEAVRNNVDRKIEQNQCNLREEVQSTYELY